MNQLNITNFPPSGYACNEAINTLCTNLFYCGEDIRSVLFTGRYEHEGKSSIAMNVMRTLASFGKRVVLVDADLRCSSLASNYRFNYETDDVNGLAQYLAGMCNEEDIVFSTDLENAYIIPAGREVLSSMQLLTSPRYRKLMEALRENFDVILVDSPPACMVVDAIEIAKYCDGALIVVAYNKGRKQDIAEVRFNLEKTGCKVLGAVLNKVELNTFKNRHYYHANRYSGYYRRLRGRAEDRNP